MPSTTPVALVAALVALCLSATTAGAAPTVSRTKIFKAGATSPVDIAGNHLHAGDTIRKGTELLRFRVTLDAPSDDPIVLFGPKGYVHVGLGLNDPSGLGFVVDRGSGYGHQTIRVRVYAQADGATVGHIYALVKQR